MLENNQDIQKIKKVGSVGTVSSNKVENRPMTAPSGEAGMVEETTENYDFDQEFNREGEDEISAYSTQAARTSIDDVESDDEYRKLDNQESNTKFTTPDEFSPTQDPSPSREDITLGRSDSSATNKSTAQAAPSSSEVSSNDAKKKI